MVKTWSGFLLAMLGGIVYAIGGILIMDEPVQGALVITLFLIAGLVIGFAAECRSERVSQV